MPPTRSSGSSTASSAPCLGVCETARRAGRQAILRHFGEAHPGSCGNCDACLSPVDSCGMRPMPWSRPWASPSTAPVKRFGAAHIVDVLVGKAEREGGARFGHQHQPVFGKGKDVEPQAWQSILSQNHRSRPRRLSIQRGTARSSSPRQRARCSVASTQRVAAARPAAEGCRHPPPSRSGARCRLKRRPCSSRCAPPAPTSPRRRACRPMSFSTTSTLARHGDDPATQTVDDLAADARCWPCEAGALWNGRFSKSFAPRGR